MEKLAAILGLQKKDDDQKEEFVDAFKPPARFPWNLVLYIGFDWIIVALGAIFQGLGTAAPMFFYVVFQDLTNAIIGNSSGATPTSATSLKDTVNSVALRMTYIAIGVAVANGLAQTFMNIAKVRVQSKVKRLAFKKLLTFEMGYYDVKQAGDILSHVNEDTTQIVEAWTMKICLVIGHLITFVVGVVMSFTTSWIQTLVMGAALPPLMIGALIGGGFYLYATKKASDANAKCVAVANEVVAAMRTVRSMAGEEKEKQRFGRAITSFGLVNYFKTGVMSLAFGAAYFAIWGVVAMSFWFGGILITTGIDGKYKISIGDFFQLFGVSLFAIMSIAQAVSEIGHFYKSIGAAVALSQILHRHPQIRPYEGKTIPAEELKGKFEFRNVTFAYPSRPDIIVLENFNLTIEPGTSVAFVGESGSGKSTIVALIENLYQPISGDIFLDGYNVRDLDPIWYHKTIGIVSQEPVLFGTTVTNNMTYALTPEQLKAKKDTLQDEVEKAAEDANALDFILELPDGFDTLVGERGALLSGGQKQRVAIARAIIQDPKVLLLDEATSALDNESEKLVQEALDKLLNQGSNRTSVSIAHRLTTIQDCDVIVVMKKGEIVERGTHQELLALDGHYKSLATRQMMNTLEDAPEDAAPEESA